MEESEEGEEKMEGASGGAGPEGGGGVIAEGGGVRVGGVRGVILGVRAADGVGPLMETELLPTVDNPGTTRTKITSSCCPFLCLLAYIYLYV